MIRMLNEFSEDAVGFILQEAALEVEPKLISDNGKVAKFAATLQDTSDNRNKRRYGGSVLESGLTSPAVQERLRTRTMYGEANHPFSDDMKRQMSVDMTRVSHLVTEAKLDSSKRVVRGVLETASTNTGRDMRGLIVDNKSTVGFSMRGMGNVKRVPGKDLVEVTAPLAIVTYDWVTYPSHQAAYMDVAKPMAEQTGFLAVTEDAVAAYLRDQSQNVRALTEQFELDNAEIRLDETQQMAIIRSGKTMVAAFLERDVKAEFRSALL